VYFRSKTVKVWCDNGINVQAIVATVVNAFESPCRRINDTVPGVDGAQVIWNGVPALMVEKPVIVKAFWAEARDAKPARRRDKYCILFVVIIWFTR
jgi:hypothetical protein